MHTKDHGSKTVTMMTLGSSGPIVWFGTSIISKILALTRTPRSVHAISVSLPAGYGFYDGTSHPACRLRPFLGLGSVATKRSVVSLASGSWTPTRFRLCVPTPMLPLDHWLPPSWSIAVILSSTPPPLSTPIRYLGMCSAFIASQLATPTRHRPRPTCLAAI
jgi:hypothetical protein